MISKVHCRKCGLYLGTTNEEEFPVWIICRQCTATIVRVKAILAGEPEPEEEERGDSDVLHLLRMLSSGLFEKVYEFPHPTKGNGAAK